MSMDFLTELPPELILRFPPFLSTDSLNSLARTTRSLHSILQPELEARITPDLGKELLLWATAGGKAHIVRKLLAPPHQVNPSKAYKNDFSPLHSAAQVGNSEIAALLLEAGADPHLQFYDNQDLTQPLHLAVLRGRVETARVLLKHGADVNALYGSDFMSYPLHDACARGDVPMVEMLLEHGGDLTTMNGAVGSALSRRHLDVMRILFRHGATAEEEIALNPGWLNGGPPPPYSANLLYYAMALKHPRGKYSPRPIPVEGRVEVMAMLLAHGASKENAMKKVNSYLKPLAEAAELSEEEFLRFVEDLLESAEKARANVET